VGFTTEKHTGEDVHVYAAGRDSVLFRGCLENEEVMSLAPMLKTRTCGRPTRNEKYEIRDTEREIRSPKETRHPKRDPTPEARNTEHQAPNTQHSTRNTIRETQRQNAEWNPKMETRILEPETLGYWQFFWRQFSA